MCVICVETIAVGVAVCTIGAGYLKIHIDKKKLEKEECKNESNQEKKNS